MEIRLSAGRLWIRCEPQDELTRFRLKWKVLTQQEMPASVESWSWWKLDSALRLLATGAIEWSQNVGRLTYVAVPKIPLYDGFIGDCRRCRLN